MRLYLLHGNLGSPRDWDACLEPWRSSGFSCSAVDLWQLLRDGADSLEKAGDAVASLAPANEPCALVGYSLGGRLALHAAAARPGAWKALVLLSAHPGLTDPSERARRLADDRLWAAKCREMPPADFLAAWNARSALRGSGRGPSPDYDAPLAAQAFDCWSLGRQRDFGPWLRARSLPLLWLTGRSDARFTALAAQCRPDAARVVPGAGHRLLQEAPDVAARLVREFLLSLRPPTPLNEPS